MREDESERTVQVVPFVPAYGDEVGDLIVGIQRGEFAIDITADQQPDLRAIASFYQARNGNFWVALDGERVVGTISLLDIGNQQVALRKMFVRVEYRGPRYGTARHLLATLLPWARRRGVREVFLGPTPMFHAAHRFYEKSGFSEIDVSDLPEAFPGMEVAKKFDTRRIS